MYGSHSAPLMTRVSMAERSLGESLTAVGKPGAAQAHQAARLHRRNERSVVRHLGRNTGRVRRLLAVGPDDDSRYRTAVGHMHGLHGLHGAGHAAVDGCADETARRAHNGTHQHRIALFTVGVHGAPICCCMGSTIFSGRGMATVAIPDVFFSCGTRAPRALRLNLDDMKI